MTHRITNKNIDIYSFPNEFEDNLGSVTLGDLHGNSIKLIHFLFRQKLIRFKSDIKNPEETYQKFVLMYEQYGEIVQEYMENRTHLELCNSKIDNNQDRLSLIDKKILKQTSILTEENQSLTLQREQTTSAIAAAEANKIQIKQRMIEPKAKLLESVNEFNQFMNSLEVADCKTLARLIGDEVFDRGNCDYFTLKIIDFFLQNKGKMTILFSNHGCEFISAYERLLAGQDFQPQGRILDTQMTSFYGLKLLLDNEIIKQEELFTLINQSYKPCLKILDYSFSDKGITLFSHAPIRFDGIELLARQLGVTYNDVTKEALASTIDQINEKFQVYVERNSLSSLFYTEAAFDITHMSQEDRCAWPIIYTTWNRWCGEKETDSARPADKNNYDLVYVHGHDSFQSKLAHVHNLDTLCGKNSRTMEQEEITKAFQFILENKHKDVDKSAYENYLRLVGRYKVFDTEYNTLKNPNNSANNSAKALSGLGKPVPNRVAAKDVFNYRTFLGKNLLDQSSSNIYLSTAQNKF